MLTAERDPFQEKPVFSGTTKPISGTRLATFSGTHMHFGSGTKVAISETQRAINGTRMHVVKVWGIWMGHLEGSELCFWNIWRGPAFVFGVFGGVQPLISRYLEGSGLWVGGLGD